MPSSLYKSIFLVFLFFNNISLSQNEISKMPIPGSVSEQKTVLLTGAAGFIGSNFLKYMFDKYPQYHFLVLDSLTYAGTLDNIPRYILRSSRFEFFYGSVTNYQLVDLLMSKANLVVHFAAESHVAKSITDDVTFFETDVMGTRVIMTALTKYTKNIERFIHISTSEACGTAETETMDENHPINPRSPYAAAKAAAERLVYAYCCTYNVPAVIVRPFNNYGPQQHLEKVIPRFISSAIKKQPLTIQGDGLQTRDWVYTLDIAHALDLILHAENFHELRHQVIHLGSGKATSILEIAHIILDYFNLPESSIKFVNDRPGQVRSHCSSTEKAQRLLGWKAETKLKEGLHKTIEWYLDNQIRWEKMEATMYTPIYTNENIMELQ